jgi:hypothetical protein
VYHYALSLVNYSTALLQPCLCYFLILLLLDISTSLDDCGSVGAIHLPHPTLHPDPSLIPVVWITGHLLDQESTRYSNIQHSLFNSLAVKASLQPAIFWAV